MTERGPGPRSSWLLALLVTTACSLEREAEAGKTAPAKAAKAAPTAPAKAAPAKTAAASAAPTAPGASSPISAQARQLIVAVADDWSATTAELSRWQRSQDDAPWQLVGEPWSAVTGSGLAWGRGLHGEGPPAGQSGQTKVEGDGKSPAGVFALGGAYGYSKRAPKGAHWPYTPVDSSWYCVDDGASRGYGTVLDADTVSKDWASAEKMRRRDALYTWVVDVAHNPAHQPGGGSCIFLHVWRSATSPTVGCTAMAQGDLETLLTWMEPSARPVFVLLPRAAYGSLAASWRLPPR